MKEHQLTKVAIEGQRDAPFIDSKREHIMIIVGRKHLGNSFDIHLLLSKQCDAWCREVLVGQELEWHC